MRVRDWRVHQLGKLANVEIFRGSRMEAGDVAEVGADHVLVATGSRWRRDGRGRTFRLPIFESDDARIVDPELIVRGDVVAGPVVVFDDDHYYVASAVAELLASRGLDVTYVTSEGKVSAWSDHTAEQARAHGRLLEMGVRIIVNMAVAGLGKDMAKLRCLYSGRQREIACARLVPVTSREPEDRLWRALKEGGGPVHRLGDCLAPGLIVHAVHGGHRIGRELGEDIRPARRERALV